MTILDIINKLRTIEKQLVDARFELIQLDEFKIRELEDVISKTESIQNQCKEIENSCVSLINEKEAKYEFESKHEDKIELAINKLVDNKE